MSTEENDPDPGLTYPRAAVRAAFRDGKAAGYAEAVADLRRWLVAECKEAHVKRLKHRPSELSRVIRVMDAGAHVGAAKKGAT